MGPQSLAAKLAAETVQRRGSGQRCYRNSLLFAAADASTVATARENAKRERAWHSILNDADLIENLTRAQTRDAETQAARSRQSLQQSIRGAWVHILFQTASGRSSSWLCHSIGAPDKPGWDETYPRSRVGKSAIGWNRAGHTRARQPGKGARSALADGKTTSCHRRNPGLVCQLVYLPRVRDDAVLDTAVQHLCADLEFPYAYASAFNEDTALYEDVVDGKVWLSADLGGGLLVRREAIQPKGSLPMPTRSGPSHLLDPTHPSPTRPGEETSQGKSQPTRFFASITIDP